MRKIIEYQRCWSMEEEVKVSNELYALLLDYPYSFPYANQEKNIRIIPSKEVINELLKSGGSHGGMSPGCIWNGFEINDSEYYELVRKLLSLNFEKIIDKHFYAPKKLIIDKELNKAYSSPIEWKKQQTLKYTGVHEFIQFINNEKGQLFLNGEKVGEIEISSFQTGSKYLGKIVNSNDRLKALFHKRIEPNNKVLIQSWGSKNRKLLGEEWFRPKWFSRLSIIDSWDVKNKVTKFYLSKNHSVILRLNFKEIKPKLKVK